jgi:hypothetical protein
VPDGDQLSVAGVDDRKLPALGFLCLGFLGFTALGNDTLPRRLEIGLSDVQAAGVLYCRCLRARASPVNCNKRNRPKVTVPAALGVAAVLLARGRILPQRAHRPHAVSRLL